MAIKLKELVKKQEGLAPGHRACSGCALPIITRLIFHSIDDPVAVAVATGCLQTVTSIYPYTSWRIPWIHSAFENAATSIDCMAAAYRSLVKQDKIKANNQKFVAIGGDGASYDIGFQFLSGAVERGRQFLYICVNNEAYMNTGIQRSSATPLGAWTTTSQVGAVVQAPKGVALELEDADYVIVAMGSVCGTIKKVIDEMRSSGDKVGLLRIRDFRPFPYQEVAAALGHKKAIALFDRSLSFGAQVHQLQLEAGYALYSHGCKAKIANYVFGIGGRDFFPFEVEQVYCDLKEIDSKGISRTTVSYLSVKE